MNFDKSVIYNACIVPAIKINDVEDAVPVADALRRGGINVIEITFRSPAALEAVKRISVKFPDMLVGAGTILTKEQVDAAVEAGAKFIVAPGFNPEIVKYCISKNVTIIPGCTSCGEMEQAMALGLEIVKFFPAEQSGGPQFLKAVYGPYKNLKFLPTGGIDETNISSYLQLPNVIACGGSFIAKEAVVTSKNYEAIVTKVKYTLKSILDMKIKHIGINHKDDAEAYKTAGLLTKFLMSDIDDHEKGMFIDSKFELLKFNGRGEKGHVAVSTNFPDRAKTYLESQGFEFDESSAQYDKDGRLNVIYLKDDIGGFAFHLIKAD